MLRLLNGISRIRRKEERLPGVREARAAATSRALSVGSPETMKAPLSRLMERLREVGSLMEALLQRTAISKSLQAGGKVLGETRRLPSSVRNSPAFSEPEPMTRIRSSSVTSSCTDIRFSVRVPVLSEQITSAQPKVSTA